MPRRSHLLLAASLSCVLAVAATAQTVAPTVPAEIRATLSTAIEADHD